MYLLINIYGMYVYMYVCVEIDIYVDVDVHLDVYAQNDAWPDLPLVTPLFKVTVRTELSRSLKTRSGPPASRNLASSVSYPSWSPFN